MTEELEKEAKDFESRKHYRYEDNDYCGDIADGIIQAYLAGAEPREKRIAELEELLINSKNLSDTIEKAQKKKIAELEKENERLTVSYETLKLHDEEEIGMLKSENTELKETLKTYNGCGDWDNDFHTCRVYLQHEELQIYVEQLIKAKDLLLRFIELKNKPCAVGHSVNMLLYENICAETVQFLNSEVEK